MVSAPCSRQLSVPHLSCNPLPLRSCSTARCCRPTASRPHFRPVHLAPTAVLPLINKQPVQDSRPCCRARRRAPTVMSDNISAPRRTARRAAARRRHGNQTLRRARSSQSIASPARSWPSSPPTVSSRCATGGRKCRSPSWPMAPTTGSLAAARGQVDPAIKAGRLLTGADFDIESFRRIRWHILVRR